ncbi:MAG: flagellar basal body rod protein FlgC [Xylanivirga thermophila]|jgi:flagellar basal-body rod protein FlgC|uniref:flagellar basal body rod protein FlgC n=1 Tax=Xylanivirga thermophila TaxID=2496273 RepID=UPI00101B5BF4|nr:flagellar basal body rod protein FlgC [Xylanivirga thermophila]
MNFLQPFDISASGLTVERLRMDVISQNIANANTTRTEEGTPYRRNLVVVQERSKTKSFGEYLNETSQQFSGTGVKAVHISKDPTPFKRVYNPSHPDANEDGYVELPNVDTLKEMVDMMSATRSFEANVTAFNATKTMAMKALEIGR